jgi:metal-responsive CopG/Arc/MetJ family transcriptional regulator
MVEVRSVRKNINFPINLLVKVNKLIQRLNVDFSKFVRQATEEYVNNFEKIQLQRELEEGYKAKAKLNLKISEDFKYVDGENI